MTTISVDIMPVLSALSENKAAAVLAGAEPVAVPQPSKEAVEAFQAAMGSLVTENREVQVALEKAAPLPLEVAKPVVAAKPLVEITPEVVKNFAEVIAPLVAENREVQVALEKVAPLPLEVTTPVVATVSQGPMVAEMPVAESATAQNRVVAEAAPVVAPEAKPIATPEAKPVVAAKPMVEITPEIVRQFAEVIAPLVTENREVQVALEKIAPLPLEVTGVPATVVPAPVTAERSETAEGRETPTVRGAVVAEAKPVDVAEAKPVVAAEATPVDVAETKPVVAAKPLVEITPEIVKQFAEVIAPLVAENREVQVALEKVAPLPLEIPVVAAPMTPEAKPVVSAKPLVEITPEVVKQFAEVIAPLVTENREVQVALEKVAPLPLDVAAPAAKPEAPVAETATAQNMVAPEAKPVVTAKPMVEVTPEIVKQFAEVIAPLVTENREVQVALEKVAPLPLEIPVVLAPVAETATVRDVAAPVAETATVQKEKAPASELPDAGMVMQAAPVMPQPQIDVSVRPVAAPAAVDGVAAAVAAQRTAPTPSEVLVAAAEAVADTIMVTPGLLTGEGQIRVQLRPDVLSGTEIQINVAGRAIAVDFLPQTADMAVLIQRCLPQLEQHLASRIHSFTITATVGGTMRRRKA